MDPGNEAMMMWCVTAVQFSSQQELDNYIFKYVCHRTTEIERSIKVDYML